MDYQSRSQVRPKKHQRDRLIRLATTHPAWALGFQDETWWSRVTQPRLHTWAADGHPLRLVEPTVGRDEPKALACYGVLWRGLNDGADTIWLRFVDGRPLSGVTTAFLDWCCQQLAAQGKTAWLLVWDRAPWHESRAVRTWIREHNRQVKQGRAQVRIVNCPLPSKSPWLTRSSRTGGTVSARWSSPRACSALMNCATGCVPIMDVRQSHI